MPDYRALARKDAIAAGIDPDIFLRQISQESGFNPNARSSAGALGIAQFMPGTAAGFHINPMNPVQALAAAAKMDAQNLHKYGSYARMLSAYNSGRPDAYKDPHFAGGQTFNYVKTIMGGKTPQVIGTGASTAPPSQTADLAQAMMTGSVAPQGADLMQTLAQLFQQNQPRPPQSGFVPF